MSGKRVLFATLGSLGDLHPYIAIGRELGRRGIAAAIATTDRYRALVEGAGLEFRAMRPGRAELGEDVALLRRAVHPVLGPRYLVRTLVMPFVRESYQDLERAAADADLLVTHPLAVAGPALAERRGLAWASSVLAPCGLMSADEPPLFASVPWLRGVRALGRRPYRGVLAAVKLALRHWERPLDALRRELGLPRGRPVLFEGGVSPRLDLALFSAQFARPARDWPASTRVCGFARFDGLPPDAAALARLKAFLAAGDPPVVFALGSMLVMLAGTFWDAALAATRRLGRRALFVTGPSGEGPPHGAWRRSASELHCCPPLPYSLVFPRSAAVVHHGGVGTLAQALAAGRPQLILPLAFDQPDNAERAVRLGVARSLPFTRARAARLAEELGVLLVNADYAEQARRVAVRINAEDGAGRAAEALESLLAG